MSVGRYLYVVVPPGTPLPADLAGLDGSPVHAAGFDGGEIWYSICPRPEANLHAIRRHHSVVAAAMTGSVTPVPLRFGNWVEEEELQALLAERGARFAALLETVAGHVELGARIELREAASETGTGVVGGASASTDVPGESGGPLTGTSTGAGGDGPGTRYLRAASRRLEAADATRRRLESIADEVESAVTSLVVDSRRTSDRSEPEAIGLAHLVRRPDVKDYIERVRDVRERAAEFRILLSGPWPPYSFAT